MKPYTLLKRSKLNPDVFALVRDNEVLVSFKPSKFYAALNTVVKEHGLKEVDVVWRDGTRTVEHLVVHHTRRLVSVDTIMNYYNVCLMLRAQGAAVSLATPVDIRAMFDANGPLISEIHIDPELAEKLVVALTPKHPMFADAHSSHEEDDDMFDDDDLDPDDDFEDEDDLCDDDFTPEEDRLSLIAWGYRAEDWSTTLTDDAVQEVHSLEVGIDHDIELPLAPDAKDKYF
ncbi:hypothetical protein MPK71_gp314 [Erwinia phage pEa_SNUABM_1]|uniref:Uncharacterized protein n=1 Tax=Erwinia phage pEa_SNUABM_1 TaxID=2869543 RepID=A0AAE8C3H6_9CAUD|nr:hypothetical protein MPK71_gp314 [Erwinia phage pEa_SNUABM_1]QZE57523.1 hypothetical protein pEaSNUABM1_00314 [Erwinia phage pEa_SNUABM_1]